MRFFGYTLADETAPTPPSSPELFEKMDAFVAEAVAAGVILATGGIAPSAMGAKVSLKDGEDMLESVLVYTVAGSAPNCLLWPTGRANLRRDGYVP